MQLTALVTAENDAWLALELRTSELQWRKHRARLAANEPLARLDGLMSSAERKAASTCNTAESILRLSKQRTVQVASMLAKVEARLARLQSSAAHRIEKVSTAGPCRR